MSETQPLLQRSIAYSKKQFEDMDRTLGIVHLVSGRTGRGEEFYAYISIQPSKYEEFFICLAGEGEPLNLRKFGEILHSGFGKRPSDEVRALMVEKHGIDHHLIARLSM